MGPRGYMRECGVHPQETLPHFNYSERKYVDELGLRLAQS